MNKEYVTLAQAAKLSPGRPSANAVWRWARKGIRSRSGDRVRLEHVRMGGKIFTTREWLKQFGQRLAADDARHFEMASRPGMAFSRSRSGSGHSRSKSQRQASIERAERELRAYGVDLN